MATETQTVTREAFARFYFRMSEINEAELRAYVAEHPEHDGDCTHQCHTCHVCLLAQTEREIAEYWPILCETCSEDGTNA